MNIFGITLVKNEDDIIAETLTKASTWCDAIYVFDTGSEDSSWEVVLDLANKNSRIVPYKKTVVGYSRGLFGTVYNQYKTLATSGDWWCRLDADEIYIDDPRDFLSGVPAQFDTIYSASFQYYFTDKDFSLWKSNPTRYCDKPAEEKLKFFSCNWSEIRFVKHSSNLIWLNEGWPKNISKPYTKRIRLKHLQYRSPEQIEKRIKTRKAARKSEVSAFWYDEVENWQEKIVPADSLIFDSGIYSFDEMKLPPIPSATHYLGLSGALLNLMRRVRNLLSSLSKKIKLHSSCLRRLN